MILFFEGDAYRVERAAWGRNGQEAGGAWGDGEDRGWFAAF
jgi:hypothetical protein